MPARINGEPCGLRALTARNVPGWTCVGSPPQIRKDRFFADNAPVMETSPSLQFRGRNRDQDGSGRYLFGIYYDLFKTVDSMVFWSEGEPVVLVVPTQYLASIFDKNVASIGAKRWRVHIHFSRHGRSELVPDNYPNKPVYEGPTYHRLDRMILRAHGAHPPEEALTENERRLALCRHRKRERRLRQRKIKQPDMVERRVASLARLNAANSTSQLSTGNSSPKGFAHASTTY